MRKLRQYIALIATFASFGFIIPAMAKDFGNLKDVQQVRKVVAQRFGEVVHVSVSHDWALCTARSAGGATDIPSGRQLWVFAFNLGGAAQRTPSALTSSARVRPAANQYRDSELTREALFLPVSPALPCS